MFKKTIRIIKSELGAINDDLQLFGLPQHPDVRRPKADRERLIEMRDHLAIINENCQQYMVKYGALHKDDEDIFKEDTESNRRHTIAMLVLLTVQLIVLSLALIISYNREKGSNCSDNGKSEDVSLIIDIPDVFHPIHSELKFKQGVSGTVDVKPMNNKVPLSFEPVHTVMHPVHVLLVASMAHHRPFMDIHPVKCKHELPRINNIFL